MRTRSVRFLAHCSQCPLQVADGAGVSRRGADEILPQGRTSKKTGYFGLHLVVLSSCVTMRCGSTGDARAIGAARFRLAAGLFFPKSLIRIIFAATPGVV